MIHTPFRDRSMLAYVRATLARIKRRREAAKPRCPACDSDRVVTLDLTARMLREREAAGIAGSGTMSGCIDCRAMWDPASGLDHSADADQHGFARSERLAHDTPQQG